MFRPLLWCVVLVSLLLVAGNVAAQPAVAPQNPLQDAQTMSWNKQLVTDWYDTAQWAYQHQLLPLTVFEAMTKQKHLMDECSDGFWRATIVAAPDAQALYLESALRISAVALAIAQAHREAFAGAMKGMEAERDRARQELLPKAPAAQPRKR